MRWNVEVMCTITRTPKWGGGEAYVKDFAVELRGSEVLHEVGLLIQQAVGTAEGLQPLLVPQLRLLLIRLQHRGAGERLTRRGSAEVHLHTGVV